MGLFGDAGMLAGMTGSMNGQQQMPGQYFPGTMPSQGAQPAQTPQQQMQTALKQQMIARMGQMGQQPAPQHMQQNGGMANGVALPGGQTMQGGPNGAAGVGSAITPLAMAMMSRMGQQKPMAPGQDTPPGMAQPMPINGMNGGGPANA